MDIALTLESFVPAAKYRGSLTDNTQAAYDALEWSDDRKKPTWESLQSAWPDVEKADKQAKIGQRLSVKFEELLKQVGPQLSAATVDEIIQLEAIGNRYLRYGQVALWQQKVKEYVPSAEEDRPLVAQLKPQILAEFD